jgi:E3 ubiquitin-protein ligase SHPRH
MNVLRVLGDIVRSNLGMSLFDEYEAERNVAERSKAFFELLEAQKREKIAAYRMWRVHLDLLNDLDELEQVKSSMRLSYDGEDLTILTEDEKNAVVQPVDIHRRYHDHTAKEAMSLGDLRRAQDKLRYLQSLVCGQSEEIECPICLNAFDERAVLRCGHSMCHKCLEDFQAHSKGQSISCPKKCTLKTNPSDILLASNESKIDGSLSARKVNGSYGTKVTSLLSDILDIRDQGDKGIVFSQWEDMLDIVQSALVENGVDFVRADSRRAMGDSVVRFRAPSVTVLLLNVKNGAEGLTLLEATHCFMVEPILNAGLDAQAISRIHRIGQRRRTYVHRYLVEGTIETKIDSIREEHQMDEESIEEALNEGRKSIIGAGGIDGGFGNQEEVMQLLS